MLIHVYLCKPKKDWKPSFQAIESERRSTLPLLKKSPFTRGLRLVTLLLPTRTTRLKKSPFTRGLRPFINRQYTTSFQLKKSPFTRGLRQLMINRFLSPFLLKKSPFTRGLRPMTSSLLFTFKQLKKSPFTRGLRLCQMVIPSSTLIEKKPLHSGIKTKCAFHILPECN